MPENAEKHFYDPPRESNSRPRQHHLALHSQTPIPTALSRQPKKDCSNTVQIPCIGTDRSQQTVQTKIRLLLKKQYDQGLRCLPFHYHLLDALMQYYIKLFYS